nr:MAG TPA: hypothetical protein [Caudoviricetes sp.]
MAEQIIKTYLDTSKGKFIFDAYFNINHESTLTITQHPIQSGASVSDHAYMEANKLSFQIGMSDVMQDVSDTSFQKFSDGNSRSISAYKVLRMLQEERIPITVVTRLYTYKNMLIETISAPDDNKTAYALKANVTLKQIFVVNVTTVKISERPQKSNEANEGDQKPQKADESILSKLFG